MFSPERAGIAFSEAGKKLGFAYRVVHAGIACLYLGLPYGKADTGALVQEVEELGVQGVYLYAQFGESGYLGRLCHDALLIFPGCLP